MNDRLAKAEAVFHEALELPPEQREAFLQQACGGDAELRREVAALLRASGVADKWLKEADCTAIEAPGPVSEGPGTVIDRYKLREKVGEGGCGVVYVADQEEPVRRRVALKVIKLGMDTKTVVARFEAERQALAMMDHPNIAKVLDAGATDTGRPYFVMELVRGIKITEYCDQHKVSTRERLDLFIKVCQAVQHAHQKGIIHRDLKPSNILVTVNDGVPVPKVIDFGIAKATEGRLTEATVYTQLHQLIGTPAYMSPEQAELTSLDIDTRSDIYSLGVLLYELLTGRTPFDAKELLEAGLDEMRRTLREKEPVRPSTRLSTLQAADQTEVARRRNADAPRLLKQLRGDMDWIVMKALEKDRTRRYETANGLATDLKRHLSNEPVVARSPSAAYRFHKLVRRNRLVFAAAATVALALLAGITLSAWQAERARRAEQNARAERDSAQTVLTFFQDNVLAAGRPEGQEGGLGKDVTLRKAIDAAEPQIVDAFKDKPLVEAAIRATLAESYLYLGEPGLAVRQHERALSLRQHWLGRDHIHTLASMRALGFAYKASGKLDGAVKVSEEALKLSRRKLGAEHTNTCQAMWILAEAYLQAGRKNEAFGLLQEALKLTTANLGSEHPDTLAVKSTLAVVYSDSGRPRESIALHEEVLRLRKAKLGLDHPDTLQTMNLLANAYVDTARFREAIALHEETLKLRKTKLGLEHPSTLRTMHNLASAYEHAGRRREAIALFEETLKLQKTKLGLDHPNTFQTMQNLGWAYRRAGSFEQSIAHFEELLKLRKLKLGPDHSDALSTMNDLGAAYWDAGKLDQAEAIYRERLTRPESSLTATLNLGELLLVRAETNTVNPSLAQKQRSEGEQLLRAGLATLRARYTNDAAKLESSLRDIVELFYRHGRYAEAEPLYRELVQSERARLGAEAETVLQMTASLARLLADWAWAERDGHGVPASAGSALPATSRSVLSSAVPAKAGTPYLPHERAREAETLLRECLAIRLRSTNSTHWRTGDVKSRLGAALVSLAVTDPALNADARQSKLAVAETLLLQGHERLHQSGSAERKYKADALERLVRLYQAWDKPEKLSEWQQKLEAFKAGETKSAKNPEEDTK